MILDVHAYIGKWPYWPLPCGSPADVVGIMDRCGIGGAVVSSTRGLFVNWPDGNRETAEAAAAHAGRLIAFATVGPPELSHALHACEFRFTESAPFRGIRLYPQYHTYHLLYEPFVDQVCEEAEARRWPVQLPLRVLMNWGMPMLDLGWMAALVERHPRVPWILTGLNYFHELRVGLALMRRFADVHLETSCIQGFQAIAKIVAECGSERLLFGSGLPLQNAAAGVSKIEHAAIRDADREAIFGGNARRLLDLRD
ncbi:MAG TPA: amidohydrolase family protein [Bryobacteraceae bacterium]|nr:amidohydrolase family protein [Bryobacteraceae bacterium]